MKFKINFNQTLNVDELIYEHIYYKLVDEIKQRNPDINISSEQNISIEEQAKDITKQLVNKFVRHNTSVQLEFDTENVSAVVCERK